MTKIIIRTIKSVGLVLVYITVVALYYNILAYFTCYILDITYDRLILSAVFIYILVSLIGAAITMSNNSNN